MDEELLFTDEQRKFLKMESIYSEDAVKIIKMTTWGGRREEGSGWGTHVNLWRIHFDIWQI